MPIRCSGSLTRVCSRLGMFRARPPAGLVFLAFTLGPSVGFLQPANAQPVPDEHMQHEEQTQSAAPQNRPAHDMSSQEQEHMSLMAGPLGIARARMGSGTSWLPDSSPMYGSMMPLGLGGVMLHGNIFAGYDWFGSDRGSDRFISMNSIMGMAWHPLGPGEIMARLMLSAEPLTVGERGYPLILQTGETANGEPLHDRQHPHDLFMELGVSYTLPVSSDVGLQLYVAPAGEPALGPTAFPHRISAISDPLAPLGHHWQDSTHIAFGVVTAGVFTRHVKLEGSWFNGREPDENRWNLDLRVPDSSSGRLTWDPNASWSLQGSYGYLSSPESVDPTLSLHRVTASAVYNQRMGDEANWATTFVFGENIASDGPPTHSFLVESNWNTDGHHVVYGRAEYVRKTGHDLVLPPELEDSGFNVGMLGLGYVYYLGPFASMAPGIGVRGTAGLVEGALDPFYGTRLPVGAMIFVQLRPAAMPM